MITGIRPECRTPLDGFWTTNPKAISPLDKAPLMLGICTGNITLEPFYGETGYYFLAGKILSKY
jgi:hypothetical protein